MLQLLTLILSIILISRLCESLMRVPFTLALIVTAYSASLLFPRALSEISANFDEILYMMLPVILLPDVLQLSLRTIRKNLGVLLYLAIGGVLIAVLVSSLLSVWALAEYQLSVGMLLALYSMLMATDAITVNSVFQHFNIPERLKICAEGESLLNDISALILFYFVALPMITTNDFHLLGVNLVILKVVLFSTLLGVLISSLAYLVLKFLHDSFEQIVLIYLVTIVAFMSAEHLQLSGILSIVASIMTLKYFVDRENRVARPELPERQRQGLFDYRLLLNRLNRIPAISGKEFWVYKKEAYYIGMFANSVVFIAIANLVKFEQLLNYASEILLVFAITTLARAVSTQALVLHGGVPNRWRQVLTLSGMKGGLAIIMVHSLPEDFIYREMFEAIVVGIALLSTFVYTGLLVTYLSINRARFDADRLQSDEPGLQDFAEAIETVIHRDTATGAFNSVVFENKLLAEINRSVRYKLDLSLLILQIDHRADLKPAELRSIGEAINSLLRQSDVLGRLSENRLAILCANTPLEGVMVLVERIKCELTTLELPPRADLSIGYAELSEGDTGELFLEHVEASLKPIRSANRTPVF